MLCPHCGNPLRESKKSADYLLCDHCMKKIRVENAIPERPRKKKSHIGVIIVGIVLALAIVILIAALSLLKSNPADESISDDSGSSSSELDSLGDIDVDRNLFDVTITLPAEYAEGMSQEELDEAAESEGYQAVLNDDGSITYTMTKAQHAKMMEDLKASLEESMASMVGSEEYPDITSVTANEDYTEFTITTKNSEVSFAESFGSLALFTYSGIYHIFDGTPVDNIHIDYVNATTGEIIESSDSKNLEQAE